MCVAKEPYPRIIENWTPDKAGITDEIPLFTKESVQAYKQLIMEWNGDGNSCSKFSSVYGGLYKVHLNKSFVVIS